MGWGWGGCGVGRGRGLVSGRCKGDNGTVMACRGSEVELKVLTSLTFAIRQVMKIARQNSTDVCVSKAVFL